MNHDMRKTGAAIEPAVEPGSGGFSDSFMVKMIRDFFILLIVVMAVELGIKLTLSLYKFDQQDRGAVQDASKQLAEDVRSIMLNEGGPVAARTVYPILKRNYADRDLLIAVEPAEVTVSSIERTFGFKPQGLPAEWPDGRYRESTVDVRAEQWCLQCHVGAQPGDTLGTVSVRSYLGSHLASWWAGVQVSGILGLMKIGLHTVVLFFLLRARMEPVLSLRSVVGRLSRAGGGLGDRAPVRSHDEFGELANDLNRFLDRLTHIIEDLGGVLSKLRAVNTRLSATHAQMHEGLAALRPGFRRLARDFQTRETPEDVLDTRWLRALESTLRSLAPALREGRSDPEEAQRIESLAADLERTAETLDSALSEREGLGERMVALSGELDAFDHFMEEMAVLEEKMQHIAETGQTLVQRLNPQATQ